MSNSVTECFHPSIFDAVDDKLLTGLNLVDKIDDDFLMMEVEMELSSKDEHFSLVGFADDEESRGKNSGDVVTQLPSLITSKEKSVHRVSPEPQFETRWDLAETPTVTELQDQLRRNLRKLKNSMRRSDQTRSVLKRQRACSDGLDREYKGTNFFCSARLREIEQTRSAFSNMINRTCS
jgi:hypothetical protein